MDQADSSNITGNTTRNITVTSAEISAPPMHAYAANSVIGSHFTTATPLPSECNDQSLPTSTPQFRIWHYFLLTVEKCPSTLTVRTVQHLPVNVNHAVKLWIEQQQDVDAALRCFRG